MWFSEAEGNVKKKQNDWTLFNSNFTMSTHNVNQFPSINFHLIFQVSFPKLKRFALPGGTALCLALLGLSAPPAPRPACVSGGASGGAVVSASDQVEASGAAVVGASEMRGLTRMWRCWPLERFSWTILGRTERGKWTVTKFSSYREVSMSEMYIYRNVTIERVIQQFWRVWKKSITYLKRDSWCWFRLWNFNSTGDGGMIMRSTSFSLLNTSHVIFCPITS